MKRTVENMNRTCSQVLLKEYENNGNANGKQQCKVSCVQGGVVNVLYIYTINKIKKLMLGDNALPFTGLRDEMLGDNAHPFNGSNFPDNKYVYRQRYTGLKINSQCKIFCMIMSITQYGPFTLWSIIISSCLICRD